MVLEDVVLAALVPAVLVMAALVPAAPLETVVPPAAVPAVVVPADAVPAAAALALEPLAAAGLSMVFDAAGFSARLAFEGDAIEAWAARSSEPDNAEGAVGLTEEVEDPDEAAAPAGADVAAGLDVVTEPDAFEGDAGWAGCVSPGAVVSMASAAACLSRFRSAASVSRLSSPISSWSSTDRVKTVSWPP